MSYVTTITITHDENNDTDAIDFGIGVLEHLQETYNDDGTLDQAAADTRHLDEPAPLPMSGAFIVVTGNPVDGFTHYGPFPGQHEAIEFGEKLRREGDYWTVPLVSPQAGD